MRMAHPLLLAAAMVAPLPLAAQSSTPVPTPPARQAPAKPPVPPAKPQQQAAPQAAPAKSYKPVAVKLPAPMNDASFEAFRKQLGIAAQKKDRAALSKLVVAQGFFWETDAGDKADKKKNGFDNLVAVLGLDKKESDGWDMLTGYSSDPTAMPFGGDRRGVFCAPADPEFDEKALEEVAKATGTDPGEWGYPMAAGVEVRASMKADAAVTEKLGMHFVQVIPDDTSPAPNQMPMLKVVTPSGKTGFVPGDALAPLGNDQLCYVKQNDGWKITGYVGG